MAVKTCVRCKEEKTLAHFIAVNSIIHQGTLPICRECLAKQIAAATKEEGTSWNIADKMCQWADVPFIPEEWDKIYAANGRDALGVYISIFRSQPYSGLTWKQYNDVYKVCAEENRLEDAMPTIKEGKMRKLRKKWGERYDDFELEYLENLHEGLLNSQNVVGALNEDQALKLCKISLIIENKIAAQEDFSRELKSYDDLSKLANLTPKAVKEANEFNSFGEVFAYLEKKGWVNQFYDNATRDEVDYSMKDIKYWLQYLYVNETGVADEIDHRIEQLKIAASLSGTKFDEEEFRNYMKEQGQIHMEEDEFEVDI